MWTNGAGPGYLSFIIPNIFVVSPGNFCRADENRPIGLAALLDGGKIDGAIMERYAAASIDTSRGYSAFWLPRQDFERYRMALGLWKGDQTLYRAVHSVPAQSRRKLPRTAATIRLSPILFWES